MTDFVSVVIPASGTPELPVTNMDSGSPFHFARNDGMEVIIYNKATTKSISGCVRGTLAPLRCLLHLLRK